MIILPENETEIKLPITLNPEQVIELVRGFKAQRYRINELHTQVDSLTKENQQMKGRLSRVRQEK